MSTCMHTWPCRRLREAGAECVFATPHAVRVCCLHADGEADQAEDSEDEGVLLVLDTVDRGAVAVPSGLTDHA